MKRTSRIFSLAVVCATIFLWSCKKNNPDPNGGGVVTDDFLLVYTDSGTFPANAQLIYDLAPVGFKVQAYSASFPSNVDQELAANNTSRDKVISIKGKSMEVKITSPSGQTFDFMDSVWVYVQKHNSSEDPILFGSYLGYPQGLTVLPLVMSDKEVKDVFNADSVNISMTGTKRAGNHTIAPNTKVEFKSNILGIFDVTP